MDTQAILTKVNETALHSAVNLQIIEAEAGKSVIRFEATDFTKNIAGVMHGGFMYSFLDVACYTALAPRLKSGQNAVTHDIQCSVIRPVKIASIVEVCGEVTGLSKTVAFCSARAFVKGKLVATGSVTKSIVVMPKENTK